jgi:hypothetical protein
MPTAKISDLTHHRRRRRSKRCESPLPAAPLSGHNDVSGTQRQRKASSSRKGATSHLLCSPDARWAATERQRAWRTGRSDRSRRTDLHRMPPCVNQASRMQPCCVIGNQGDR